MPPRRAVALPLMAAVAFELAGPVPAATIMGAYEGLSKRYGVKMPRELSRRAAESGRRERASGALDADIYQQAFELRSPRWSADEIVTSHHRDDGARAAITWTPGDRPGPRTVRRAR